ncbi:MAG: tetratricopeptide repeat protein [Planctomycetes bacterium]|nr:tetratricopeptide repeat protein [Planctomycetota bacterium]
MPRVSTGRNDPCPCGSGRKYKKCCLSAAEAEAPRVVPAPAGPSPAECQQLGALLNSGQLVALEGRAQAMLARYPASGFLWNLLGAVLSMQGKDGLQALQKARTFLPMDPEVLANLGSALGAHGRYEEAEDCCLRAIANRPGFAPAHINLGNVRLNQGRWVDAEASYRRALQLKPDYTDAHSGLLFIHNYRQDASPAAMLAEAQRYGEAMAARARPFQHWDNPPDPDRCLRIGLLSGDLGAHPVGYFLVGVLRALAAQQAGRLEFFAYANRTFIDDVNAQLRVCCRDWCPTAGLDDRTLANRIRDDGIDLPLDLAGHTLYNRLPVLAWRPAPVQITWLGYFATTGVAAVDYLLADPWSLPDSEAGHFTERIWRLPETRLCFTPPDVAVAVGPLPALASGCVTFGCFNKLTKINDGVVALWSRLLGSVPGSRLFLKAEQLGEAAVRGTIVGRFAAHGLGAERLILEEAEPRAAYLATYRRVDIALDPFPYTGATTSAESLWMGVPVLTLAGQRFPSRQGVSLLQNVGLPEWIAADQQDYVARAAAHAADLEGLAALRQRLRPQLLASPFCDAVRFARHFAGALRGMWTQWCDRQRAGGAGGGAAPR